MSKKQQFAFFEANYNSRKSEKQEFFVQVVAPNRNKVKFFFTKIAPNHFFGGKKLAPNRAFGKNRSQQMTKRRSTKFRTININDQATFGPAFYEAIDNVVLD